MHIFVSEQLARIVSDMIYLSQWCTNGGETCYDGS